MYRRWKQKSQVYNEQTLFGIQHLLTTISRNNNTAVSYKYAALAQKKRCEKWHHKKLQGFSSSRSHNNLRLCCCSALGNALGSTASQQEGQIHRWSRTVASCHFKTSERRQHHTEVMRSMTAGYIYIMWVKPMFSFSAQGWQNQNGHRGPKIQTHGSSCWGAKMNTASGNAVFPFVCQGEALEEENTSHTITTLCDTWTPAAYTHWPLAASSCFLFPLCPACGCFPRPSNPFIQTLWRLMVHWSVSKPADSNGCILLETTGAGREKGMEEERKGGGEEVRKSKVDKQREWKWHRKQGEGDVFSQSPQRSDSLQSNSSSLWIRGCDT